MLEGGDDRYWKNGLTECWKWKCQDVSSEEMTDNGRMD